MNVVFEVCIISFLLCSVSHLQQACKLYHQYNFTFDKNFSVCLSTPAQATTTTVIRVASQEGSQAKKVQTFCCHE